MCGERKRSYQLSRHDFSRYYGFEAHLCKPYRARTKGKIESGIKYVKTNFFALYGGSFKSLEDLNQKLKDWAIQVADERIHGTTHEKPSTRFQSESLTSIQSRPRYRIEENMSRIVPSDCLVVFKTNRYSVPWIHVGKEVTLKHDDERIKILYEGSVLAEHALLQGKYGQSVLAGHFEGILNYPKKKHHAESLPQISLWSDSRHKAQERDLSEYESLCEGALS